MYAFSSDERIIDAVNRKINITYGNEYNRIKGSGIILFCKKTNKCLAVQNPTGKYGFPKGHLKDNEAYVKGAFRELKEETGIDTQFRIHAFMIAKDVVYYIILTNEFELNKEKIITKHEISNILWVNIFELPSDNTTIAIKTFIKFYPTATILHKSLFPNDLIKKNKGKSLDIRWTNAIKEDDDYCFIINKINYIFKTISNIEKKLLHYKESIVYSVIIQDYLHCIQEYYYLLKVYKEFINKINLTIEFYNSKKSIEDDFKSIIYEKEYTEIIHIKSPIHDEYEEKKETYKSDSRPKSSSDSFMYDLNMEKYIEKLYEEEDYLKLRIKELSETKDDPMIVKR